MELENGKYRARGVQGALGLTSGGKEQVAVEFQLLGERGDEHYVGQSITWFGFFTDNTLEHTIKGLRACGWQGDDVSDLVGINTNEVSLVIENEEYEGQWRPRVRWVNAPGGGLALKQQMDVGQAKNFAQQMRGRILALEQGTGQRKAPQQPASRPTSPARSAPPSRSAAPQGRGGGYGGAYSRGGAYQDDVPPPGDDDNIPF